MEHGISPNRPHPGSDDIGCALSPMSDSAEGATDGISFVREGGEGLRTTKVIHGVGFDIRDGEFMVRSAQFGDESGDKLVDSRRLQSTAAL